MSLKRLETMKLRRENSGLVKSLDEAVVDASRVCTTGGNFWKSLYDIVRNDDVLKDFVEELKLRMFHDISRYCAKSGNEMRICRDVGTQDLDSDIDITFQPRFKHLMPELENKILNYLHDKISSQVQWRAIWPCMDINMYFSDFLFGRNYSDEMEKFIEADMAAFDKPNRRWVEVEDAFGDRRWVIRMKSDKFQRLCAFRQLATANIDNKTRRLLVGFEGWLQEARDHPQLLKMQRRGSTDAESMEELYKRICKIVADGVNAPVERRKIHEIMNTVSAISSLQRDSYITQGAVLHVVEGLQAHNPEIINDAMPPSQLIDSALENLGWYAAQGGGKYLWRAKNAIQWLQGGIHPMNTVEYIAYKSEKGFDRQKFAEQWNALVPYLKPAASSARSPQLSENPGRRSTSARNSARTSPQYDETRLIHVRPKFVPTPRESSVKATDEDAIVRVRPREATRTPGKTPARNSVVPVDGRSSAATPPHRAMFKLTDLWKTTRK
jgi:hypothetical protein